MSGLASQLRALAAEPPPSTTRKSTAMFVRHRLGIWANHAERGLPLQSIAAYAVGARGEVRAGTWEHGVYSRALGLVGESVALTGAA